MITTHSLHITINFLNSFIKYFGHVPAALVKMEGVAITAIGHQSHLKHISIYPTCSWTKSSFQLFWFLSNDVLHNKCSNAGLYCTTSKYRAVRFVNAIYHLRDLVKFPQKSGVVLPHLQYHMEGGTFFCIRGLGFA